MYCSVLPSVGRDGDYFFAEFIGKMLKSGGSSHDLPKTYLMVLLFGHEVDVNNVAAVGGWRKNMTLAGRSFQDAEISEVGTNGLPLA